MWCSTVREAVDSSRTEEFVYLIESRLRIKRLILRRFSPDDVDEAQKYRDDPEFAKFLPDIPQPFTSADARRFVETNIEGPWDRYPTFAIEYRGNLIGTVELEIDADDRTAMIGYAIGREQWGKGIAVEAARPVITWGFESFDISKIWASTDSHNAQSRRVLEKLGMRHSDTILNHHLDRSGNSGDEVVYEVLRNEWEPGGAG